MTYVNIKVTISGDDWEISDSDVGVRLNDDDVQTSAAGLAYGLVEEAWGHVPDED